MQMWSCFSEECDRYSSFLRAELFSTPYQLYGRVVYRLESQTCTLAAKILAALKWPSNRIN